MRADLPDRPKPSRRTRAVRDVSPLNRGDGGRRVMAYYHFVIIVLSGLQSLWLAALHNRGVVKWEPVWVIFISFVGYLVDLLLPDAEWIRPKLTNGEYVDWTRAAGWMCTCPVLILFLVSMTTFGGREASVRVVPLYARATRAETPPVHTCDSLTLSPPRSPPRAGSLQTR